MYGAPDEYRRVQREADATGFHSENNDCVVLAIALTLGVSYAEAHEACRKQGRRAGCGTSLLVMVKAIEELGGRSTPIGLAPNRLCRAKRQEQLEVYGPAKTLHSRTKELLALTPGQVEKFPKVWEDGKTYIAATSRHVLVIQNGRVLDWTRGRRHRITKLFEVSK